MKKILAIMLAVFMLVSVFSVNAFAVDETEEDPADVEKVPVEIVIFDNPDGTTPSNSDVAWGNFGIAGEHDFENICDMTIDEVRALFAEGGCKFSFVYSGSRWTWDGAPGYPAAIINNDWDANKRVVTDNVDLPGGKRQATVELDEVLKSYNISPEDINNFVFQVLTGDFKIYSAKFIAMREPIAISINGKDFDGTLQEAVNAAEDGATIKVGKKLTEDGVVVPEDKEITIDIGGNALTMDVTNSGKLALTNGTVDGAIVNTGALTLDNVTVKSSVTVNYAGENVSLTVNGNDTVVEGDLVITADESEETFEEIIKKISVELNAGFFKGKVTVNGDALNFEYNAETPEEPEVKYAPTFGAIASGATKISNDDGSITVKNPENTHNDSNFYLTADKTSYNAGDVVKIHISGNAEGYFRPYLVNCTGNSEYNTSVVTGEEEIIVDESSVGVGPRNWQGFPHVGGGDFDVIITYTIAEGKTANAVCFRNPDGGSFGDSQPAVLNGSYTINVCEIYTEPKPVEPEYEVTVFEKASTIELHDGGAGKKAEFTFDRTGSYQFAANFASGGIIMKGAGEKLNVPEGIKVVINSITIDGIEYQVNDKYIAEISSDGSFLYTINNSFVNGPICTDAPAMNESILIKFDVIDPNAKEIIPGTEEPTEADKKAALYKALGEKAVKLADGTKFTDADVKLFGYATIDGEGIYVIGEEIIAANTGRRQSGVIYINEEYHGMLVNGHLLTYPHEADNAFDYCPVCHAIIEKDEEVEVEVVDPTEPGDVNTEPDEPTIDVTDPEPEQPKEEKNPPMGIAFAVLPMAVAAAALVSSKRR